MILTRTLSFTVLYSLVLVTQCYTNKYSESLNKDENNDDIDGKIKQLRPFRMKKTNHLWTMARKDKNLDEDQKMELYRDLEKLDRLEIRLKKLRSENGDQDGLWEEKALHKFKALAEKYSLNDPDSLDDHEYREIKKTDSQIDSIYFEDFKLRQLWTQAETSGFSDEDLALLQQEFTHQQMKIDQFKLLHNEDLDIFEAEDNSVHLDNELDSQMKDETKDRLITKQRDRLAIQDGFSHLEQLTASLTSSGGEFTDLRVNSLWVIAQRANWTEKELDSFKNELSHFEKRLSKQKVYTEQLRQSRQRLGHTRDPDNHAFLEEKNKLLDKEVKKFHSGLKKKLIMRHSEL